MGMTDRQFDSYRKDQLRLFERVEEEIQEIAAGRARVSKTLETMIKDTREDLQRP
jgi:hypothetical protein